MLRETNLIGCAVKQQERTVQRLIMVVGRKIEQTSPPLNIFPTLVPNQLPRPPPLGNIQVNHPQHSGIVWGPGFFFFLPYPPMICRQEWKVSWALDIPDGNAQIFRSCSTWLLFYQKAVFGSNRWLLLTRQNEQLNRLLD